MAHTDSCVTIHMVASLDGFIARSDGRVDWLEVSDEFEDGDTLDAEFVQAFLQSIDCYVMGSRTYETALEFEAKGLIGEGLPFFTALGRDVALHLVETKAYASGMVALRYQVRTSS